MVERVRASGEFEGALYSAAGTLSAAIRICSGELKNAFEKWVKVFDPEIIVWNWGYDGTIGEYGDTGLTPELHVQLALEIKKMAEDVCNGRLVVVLCGGSQRRLASFLIPRVIEVLLD